MSNFAMQQEAVSLPFSFGLKMFPNEHTNKHAGKS